MLIEYDECVHVIERRMFSGDVRRHFVGRVVAAAGDAIRVSGYLFVYDSGSSRFVKKPELRMRIFRLDNRVIVNVLPSSVDPNDLRYAHDADGNLSITDGKGVDLDISEFGLRD